MLSGGKVKDGGVSFLRSMKKDGSGHFIRVVLFFDDGVEVKRIYYDEDGVALKTEEYDWMGSRPTAKKTQGGQPLDEVLGQLQEIGYQL